MKSEDIKKLLNKEGFLQMLRNLSAQQRYIAGFCLVVLLLGVVRLIFDPGHSNYKTVQNQNIAVADTLKNVPEETDTVGEQPDLRGPKRTWPYYSNPIVTWHDPEFSDMNDVQLIAAKENGISHPISSRKAAETLVAEGGLVYAAVSPLYVVDDKMKHSIPYLVPKAYKLLNRIALNFMDSLKVKGIPAHKLIVTSILRTQEDVGRLQKSNRNAVTASCHEYATTFDITYLRYKEMEDDPQGDKHDYQRVILMKRALGETLRDLRYEGRCYVKHEGHQSCFHVTVR